MMNNNTYNSLHTINSGAFSLDTQFYFFLHSPIKNYVLINLIYQFQAKGPAADDTELSHIRPFRSSLNLSLPLEILVAWLKPPEELLDFLRRWEAAIS
ncbi:MAG: hypothetical protein JRJ42_00755 [Deltaproteobacteria bacterium]|nr:hypothetical protein [Deltaproteobacteria bacterium]